MLVIKILSERKKVFRERKKCKKIRAKRDCIMVVKKIVNRLLEEVEESLFRKKKSWNGSLSKTLMMKNKRIKKSLYAKRPPPSWTINHLRVNANNMDRPIASAAIYVKMGVLQIGIKSQGYRTRVMSSPNHHTSNIEYAFSSNFADYILASSNYVLASLGKTYSSSSNNSFGLVLIASPALLLFHDDPYKKFMHAYYAKESPIPPPVIMPPSPMLLPMFNLQEFFPPEELLPSKKRGRDRSSSSTLTLPQEFEIGESSRKTSLEHHEEEIEEIMNHLDELSLDRIENMETT
nr:hypothetical protein [Tanacetum cinerariifolium]